MKLSHVALAAILLAHPTLAAPTVFWSSSPVRPGETAMLIGEGFGASPTVELARLPDAPGNPSEVAWHGGAKAEVLQSGPQSVKFVVPATLKPGVYAWRLAGEGGAAIGLLDRPAVWWALCREAGPRAVPGGALRLFGHDLDGPKPVVRLSGPSERNIAADAQPYQAMVELPANLAPGEYQLRYHRGYGDGSAWSEPIPLTVAAPEVWPQTVVNVRDCGADGTGARDDTAAIQSALDKAGAAGGGVVLLPRGRYQVTDTLKMPRFTVLRGEADDRVAVFWPELTNPPEALIRGTNHFKLERLTLYASRCRHVIVGDLGDQPGAGNVRLWRVRVRADAYRGHLKPEEVDERLRESLKWSTGGGDTVRLGGENVSVEECDLYGSGRSIYLSRARGASVVNNTLYQGRWGWYCFEGCNGLLLLSNRWIGGDLQSTGGSLANYSTPASENVFYANNELSLMHGWDREAMTTDAGGGAYYGGVAAADGTSLTLAADPTDPGRNWTGAALFILDGRGRGQFRRVVKLAGRTVTLDRPWQVPPDATSVVSLTMFHGRYHFVGNHFSDAGVSIQLYGTACEVIAADNTSTRTAGFHNFGMNYHGIQPSWYVQWLDNVIDEGNCYRSGHDNHLLSGEAHLGIFALPPSATFATPLTLGCVARRNVLQNNAHLAVGGSDPYNPAYTQPVVQDAIVEGNTVRDSDVGVFVRRASRGIVVRNNAFERVVEPQRDEVAMLAAAAKRRQELLAKPGPLAAWTFDELRGTQVPDVTGNRLDATPTGKIMLEPGHRGNAIHLTGQSHLQVNEPELFNLTDLTLSLWVKPETVKGRHGLIAKRFQGTAAPFVLSLWDGGIEFEATDTDGRWSFNFRTPVVLKENVWQHVAAVVTQGQGVAIYVDGKEVGRKDNPAARMSNSEPLVIGREAWGGVNLVHEPCWFQGWLDEVKVYGRALTAAQVAEEAK